MEDVDLTPVIETCKHLNRNKYWRFEAFLLHSAAFILACVASLIPLLAISLCSCLHIASNLQNSSAKEKEKCSLFLEKNKNSVQSCKAPDASTTASVHLWLSQNLLINT